MNETAIDHGTRVRTHVPRGIPLFPDEPRTLCELFIRSAEKYPHKDAFNYKRDGKWQAISSADAVTRSEDIAMGLYSLGMRKGDRAAILAPNSPEWTLADAGCQFGGFADVPIYTTLTSNSVEFILKDSGTRVLFIQGRGEYEAIRDAAEGCPTLEHVVFFDGTGVDGPGTMSLAELEAAGRMLRDEDPELIGRLRSTVGPDDVATLIYTSGTTGEPKGVMLSHSNIVSNVIDAGEKYTFSREDHCLSVLPLSHIFERTGMYLYIFNGMRIFYAESIEKVPDNLQEIRPTLFIGVPRIFEKVYAKAKLAAGQSSSVKESIFDWAIETAKEFAAVGQAGTAPSTFLKIKHAVADRIVYSKLRAFFGGNLRFCITGGAALSDDIYLIFIGAGIPIMQGYGLTETSPVLTSNNPLFTRVGTVGKPIRNVQIRIAADGEIEAAGPGIMLGYYNRPQANAEAFSDDGWFRTGDIGEIDGDGFLKITDRKKELFKTSGGKYIAPSHIEQLLKSSRFVSQAVLVGDKRKFPAALIVPNFDQLESYARHKGLDLKTPAEFIASPRINDLFERQIAAHTEGLAQFEKVKKFALLENEMTVDGGEMTPTLKIKRRVVDEKYKDVIDRLYAAD